MANCPNINHCPFFCGKLAEMPSVSGYLKKKFCLADFSACARIIVMETLDAEFVPPDMFPNENERANNIVAAAI